MGSKTLKFVRKIIVFCLFTLLFNCFSVETSNPEKAYKYWAGENPSEEIELVKGEYYQSPHFTLEYEFFLKFKPTDKWWNAFIQQNKLEKVINNSDWFRLDNFPKWFQLNSNYLVYGKNDPYDRSRYFVDYESGVCYIYETIGM